jgi:thioredoxin 1
MQQGTDMAEGILTLTDSDFETTLKASAQPVLVDFWASWCGPCKAMEPLLVDLAQKYAGRLIVAKLNVEENARTANTYRIRALPTLMVFRDGQVQQTQIGALTRSALAAFADKALA